MYRHNNHVKQATNTVTRYLCLIKEREHSCIGLREVNNIKWVSKRFLPFEWNDNLEALLAERENFSYFKTFKDVLCYFIRTKEKSSSRKQNKTCTTEIVFWTSIQKTIKLKISSSCLKLLMGSVWVGNIIQTRWGRWAKGSRVNQIYFIHSFRHDFNITSTWEDFIDFRFTCWAAFCRLSNGSLLRFKNRRSLLVSRCGGSFFFCCGDGAWYSIFWKTLERDANIAWWKKMEMEVLNWVGIFDLK